MGKITPFLWFDGNAEEAMNHYVAIFKNANAGQVTRYGEGAPYPKGTAISVTFHLDGQDFIGLNGGPHFKFNEAISFLVDCQTQPEVDTLWQKLSAGGSEGRCGWLKDKFGLSWQIVPNVLGTLLGDKDPAKAGRVMRAMMDMGKLDIQALKDAHAGP